MRMVPVIVSCLATLLMATAAASAQEGPARGRAIVKEFCSRCHAIGRTGTSPHIGAPPFRTLSDFVDLDTLPDKLQQGISSSHPDMPTFKFKARDAQAVRAYLRSIRN